MSIRMLAAVLAVVLTGCVTDNGLSSWTGKDESWLRWKLGRPQQDDQLPTPAPGEHEPMVVSTIRDQVPGYAGVLRHMQWSSLLHTYDAYLMRTNGAWLVVDALRLPRGSH
ncbi:MAG: hypothetical protein O3B24_00735 [Verrucomicrobia bacterium]|nr:hypothetical protein [Verrucomicrobiota bacterium]